MKRRRESIFKAALLAGFLLGLLLLARTVMTYRYVTGDLLMDHLGRIATVHIADLQTYLRENEPDDEVAFASVVDSFLTVHSDEIAWLRIIDLQDSLTLESGEPDIPLVDTGTTDSLFTANLPYLTTRLRSRGQTAVRVVVPFRYRPAFLRTARQQPGLPSGSVAGEAARRLSRRPQPDQPAPDSAVVSPERMELPSELSPGESPDQSARRSSNRFPGRSPDRSLDRFPRQFQPGFQSRPRSSVAEVVFSLSGASGSYAPLRRNLIIGISAAAVLLLAMVIAALRLRSYLRGQELAQQVALAEGVQQSLLPDRLAGIPGLDLADAFVPAYGVAGDYFDVFTTRDGRVVLILGDVAGKGISAALIMSLLHGAVRMTAENGRTTLEKRVMQVNNVLANRTPPESFVTLIWACFDPATRTLEYVNCGHPPALIVRNGQDGGAVRELKTGGLVLGTRPGVEYEVGTEVLHPGDCLIIYSDGLDETASRTGEMYGHDRLTALLKSVEPGTSAHSVRDEILNDVETFRGGADITDDLTLLIARSL